jgi:hypothetical protein
MNGREAIAALTAATAIGTAVHPLVPARMHGLEQRLLNLIFDFFERHDRIDHRGIMMRARNINAIGRRFDTFLRRLDREGLRLVLAFDDAAPGLDVADRVTFSIVPKSLPVRENPFRIDGRDVVLSEV